MSFQERAMSGATPRQQSNVSPWAVGFTVFAGTLMVVNGMFQAFQGLAAIIDDEFFVVGPNYAFDLDVTTWGWIHLAVGIVVALAGFAVFSGQLWARLIGIVMAAGAMIVNFFYIPYYPVWSLLIIAVSIVVIWALASFNPDSSSEGGL